MLASPGKGKKRSRDGSETFASSNLSLRNKFFTYRVNPLPKKENYPLSINERYI